VSTSSPTALSDLPRMTAENIGSSKYTVLYTGDSGSGKTHSLLSWPEPIVVAYFDRNLETVRKHMRTGKKVELVLCRTWDEYANKFVPAVVNGEIEAETIGVDTINSAAARMWREIQGTRSRLTNQDFGAGLNRLSSTTDALAQAATQHGKRRSYNIVFCSHLKDVTDDSGALVKIRPAIMGQFKDDLAAFFDYVLVNQCEKVSVPVEENGRKRMKAGKRYFCHTIPPTRYYVAKGGDLPPEVGSTYPEMMKALKDH